MTMRFRPAQLGDHARFVRFFAELELDDPIPAPDRWATDMMPHSAFLDVDETSVGYAMFKAGGGVGHIYHVVVHPQRRREGRGRQLMEQVAERFRSEGCDRWCLNVKPENVAARRLYERFGMRNDYASSAVRLTWSQAAELEDSKTDTVARPLTTEDDPGLEERFRLFPGQIALARSKTSAVLVGVGQRGSPSLEGFASFDPHFPGAFPFRVSHLSLARPLLLALQFHAKPAAGPDDAGASLEPWRVEGLQVVVEDHDDLVLLLESVGAIRTLRILHYVGDIP